MSPVKDRLPRFAKELLKPAYYWARNLRFRYLGRPQTFGETFKAKARRDRERFFDLFCVGKGLDIGHGGDPIVPKCSGWDSEDGDAQFLGGIADESFDFVYSSHTLEHMVDPAVAVRNWWRVVKPGGFLILYIPHRDLYEKKKTLPSRWNADHKHFFLPDMDDPPDTIGLSPLLDRAISDFRLVYVKVCDENWGDNGPEEHSSGEYSIECVIQKVN